MKSETFHTPFSPSILETEVPKRFLDIVNDVINQFKNRDNWLRPKPFRSIYGDNNENKK